ncbi:SRPBCC family protein [Thiohalorhabdus methylotrophus]|uniref:SRPBCC family protein n=1 Tax=Thiohalorhabdus methylotrophus TaxID=3242694 RepID=A0ABV4U0B2_9GAMM
MKSLVRTLGILLLLPAVALAHGPTPQKAREQIHIDAAPGAVWEVLGDLSSLADWQPRLKAVQVEGSGKQAKRVLVFNDGGTITEGMDEYDPERHYMGYRLSKEDPEVFPVSFYTATLEVKPDGNGSKVEWIARFYRGDTGNFPEEGQTDEAAQKAMHGFFQDGLKGLKAEVEGG